HGHEMAAEECVALILDQLGLAHSPAEIEEGVRHLMMATLADARPVDGALDLVRHLADSGFPLAIVSSAVYHPFLTASLDKFGFAAYFQSVVTSASSGFYKSRPEIFWTALADVGAAAERSLHVGDSYAYDVLGAQRAGLATAWLSSDPEANMKRPSPDLVNEQLEGAAPAIIAALANGRS
ncbi:MAG: HAD family hydrolase, partial [Rhizobiales bacterium]|nr:HAD family hydrolase [Hyphomicrobiales bacterium]